MLPDRIRSKPKKATRWRSTAHRDFVRGFACAMCGSTANIETAHVRMNSGAGIGEKPDDWRTVPLCGIQSPENCGCHRKQHGRGEPSFWNDYAVIHGQTVEDLIAEFIKASPRRAQIEQAMRERENV